MIGGSDGRARRDWMSPLAGASPASLGFVGERDAGRLTAVGSVVALGWAICEQGRVFAGRRGIGPAMIRFASGRAASRCQDRGRDAVARRPRGERLTRDRLPL